MGGFVSKCKPVAGHARVSGCPLYRELELELIQYQMTQKPMLRCEVGARSLRVKSCVRWTWEGKRGALHLCVGRGGCLCFVRLGPNSRVLLSGKIPVESMCPLGPIFSSTQKTRVSISRGVRVLGLSSFGPALVLDRKPVVPVVRIMVVGSPRLRKDAWFVRGS